MTEKDVIEYLENNPHFLAKQIEVFQKSSSADTGTNGRKKLSPYPIDKSLNYSKKYDFWKIKSSNF